MLMLYYVVYHHTPEKLDLTQNFLKGEFAFVICLPAFSSETKEAAVEFIYGPVVDDGVHPRWEGISTYVP